MGSENDAADKHGKQDCRSERHEPPLFRDACSASFCRLLGFHFIRRDYHTPCAGRR